MKGQQENFLTIVRSAIQDEPVKLTEPVDYGRILSLAREQNLLALVGEKLCESKDFRLSSEYKQAIADTVGGVTGQTVRTSVFLDLYREFEKAGIHPIVMKGIVCRELYGKYRDHRPSGDEDLLITKEDFPIMRRVLEAKGFQIERSEVTPKELEMLQEVTFDQPESGLHIEVHTNPIGKESGIRRHMNEYFKDVFTKKGAIEIDGTKIWTMDPTDHFLFLVLHAFKHLMSGGLGIRQALDICLFYRKYQDKIEQKYIQESLRQIGAEAFWRDVLYIGRQYLGFVFEDEMSPNCPEELLEDMLDNGIFGNTTQAERTAGSMTTAAVDNREKYTQARAIYRAIFPSKEVMTAHNPELVERPWLLPFCWAKRWGRFLLHNKENGGGLAQESIRISQRRINLLKKYGVIRNK